MSSSVILAIESSCDETAISVVRFCDGFPEILSSEISSQVKLHAKWGGVVPNLAAREHVKNITPLLKISLNKAGITIKDINAIAVTQGPGLIPALMIGTGFAKTLAYLWQKPLIGIHHIEGHIYANFVAASCKLQAESSIQFPILCLVVSGGHTQLVFMENHFTYKIIGQTLDDAVGEAFDKVARILGIGYPGGPAVAHWASKFQEMPDNQITDKNNFKYKIQLPRPMLNKKNYNFSFSGLKTAVLYETKKNPELLHDEKYLAAISHEFQQACIDVLVKKTLKAAEEFQPKTIMLAGGVSANKQLREQFGSAIENYNQSNKSNQSHLSYVKPDLSLTGDNAAMIGIAAAFRFSQMSEVQKKKLLKNWSDLQPNANLKMK